MALTLTRKPGESIDLTVPGGPSIQVRIGEVRGQKVRITILAPLEVKIDRPEAKRRDGLAGEPLAG